MNKAMMVNVEVNLSILDQILDKHSLIIAASTCNMTAPEYLVFYCLYLQVAYSVPLCHSMNPHNSRVLCTHLVKGDQPAKAKSGQEVLL